MPQMWRALWEIVSFVLLWSALNAVAGNPPLPNALGSKPLQIETPVLFTGSPAVVELPQSGFKSLYEKGDTGKACNAFTLVPYAGTLQDIRVTASGLGLVDFSVSNKNVPNEVTIADLPPDGVTVTFCVHGDLIREPGSSAQGRLIAFAAGYKPATVNVKLDRPSLAPWVKALQWFAAILLPALLAAIFGIGSAWGTLRLSQRREQTTAFRKFKDDRWDDLGDFFHTHLRNILQECHGEQEFANRLRLELQSRGYWTSIPWKERDRIERFIRKQESSRMRSVLAILFWEWKSDLSELKHDSQ